MLQEETHPISEAKKRQFQRVIFRIQVVLRYGKRQTKFLGHQVLAIPFSILGPFSRKFQKPSRPWSCFHTYVRHNVLSCPDCCSARGLGRYGAKLSVENPDQGNMCECECECVCVCEYICGGWLFCIFFPRKVLQGASVSLVEMTHVCPYVSIYYMHVVAFLVLVKAITLFFSPWPSPAEDSTS